MSSAEQEPLVEERGHSPRERPVGFFTWLCCGGGASCEGTQLLLVSLFLMSLTMAAMGSCLLATSHSEAIFMDVAVEFLDCISYAMALVCEYMCTIAASPEQRRTLEFRSAVFSTVLLLMTGVRGVFGALQELLCSQDFSFDKTAAGDKPCAFNQFRPDPNMMMCIACALLFAYFPVIVIARFVNMKDFSPEESMNKASAIVHCIVDIIGQVIIITGSALMLLFPARAVKIDVGMSMLLLITLLTSVSMLWYRYYTGKARD